MARTRALPSQVDFHRTKYGREILIDIAWVREMPTFILERPHRLSFYDILLVTQGRGSFWLDGNRYAVLPRQVLFTTPGQVRDWDVKNLDGLCLFFPAAFLEEFFSDAQFLYRLPFFHAGSSAAASIRLTVAREQILRASLTRMRAELHRWRHDSAHLLRARLYETLIQLGRVYAHRHRVSALRTPNRVVIDFQQLVNQRAALRHTVNSFARELAVSPSHLRMLCRRHLGVSAKEVIQERLEVAARRQLLFTDDSAEQVAASLGFRDPSYFARFFRRRTGASPGRFRESARRP